MTEEINIRLKITDNCPDALKEFADAILERSNPDWTKEIPGWAVENKRAVSQRGRAFIEHFMRTVSNSKPKVKNLKRSSSFSDEDWN